MKSTPVKIIGIETFLLINYFSLGNNAYTSNDFLDRVGVILWWHFSVISQKAMKNIET
jgi:hypothetical protein